MATHYRDKQRQANPQKPTEHSRRLLGVNDEGKLFFYWSETKGKYAACFNKNKRDWVWGAVKLERKNGKGFHGDNINGENRVFIAD